MLLAGVLILAVFYRAEFWRPVVKERKDSNGSTISIIVYYKSLIFKKLQIAMSASGSYETPNFIGLCFNSGDRQHIPC